MFDLTPGLSTCAATTAQADRPKMMLQTFACLPLAHVNLFGTMHHKDIEYVVRASLGRDEWTLLIYFTDKANPTVAQFSGSRDEACAQARRRING